MKIKSACVQNYRSLYSVEVSLDNLTVLLGQNGCGKSCLLSALRLFYQTDLRITKEDFYNQDTTNDIKITITFCDLTPSEKSLFQPYLEGNELSVEKLISYSEPKIIQKYYGMRHVNADFDACKNAPNAAILKSEYQKLQSSQEYSTLPPYQNKEITVTTLEAWELQNQEKCSKRRDDGQFFGFRNVGTARLERYTKFIYIPAVQEASNESSEQRGSAFEEVMQLVVRGTAASPEIMKLQKETEQKFRELIDPTKNKNLLELEKNLTVTLENYVPDTAVRIRWIDETSIEVIPPRAFVMLSEGGYFNTVDRCGHGLQRAYILSLFQHLAVIQAMSNVVTEVTPTETKKPEFPTLIIAIEEPELFQHPDRQRHFCQTLIQLSSMGLEGVTTSIQIVYSTHSPLMVDFQRFNQLRIFGKVTAYDPAKPKITQVTYATIADTTRLIEKVKGLNQNEITDEAFRQRLVRIMNPWMNEGFFAKIVVLVEGINDRALIVGQALSQGIDLEGMGVSVIPVNGKMSLPEVASIFKVLKVPVFVVWDSDADKKNQKDAKKLNRILLTAFGLTPEDYPTIITDELCCIKTDLEKTFREEIGSTIFEKVTCQYCEENDLGGPSYTMENHFMVKTYIDLFKSQNHESSTLKEIVEKIKKRAEKLS